MEPTPRKSGRKRNADKIDSSQASAGGSQDSGGGNLSDPEVNPGFEVLSQPDTPSGQRYEFNYFHAKKARKSLKFEGAMKIAELNENST